MYCLYLDIGAGIGAGAIDNNCENIYMTNNSLPFSIKFVGTCVF